MPPRTASPSQLVDDRWKDDTSFNSTIDVQAYNNRLMKGKIGLSGGMSTNSPPRTLTKSLRFAKEDEIFLIRHIDDFSDEEVASIWFDQQFYATIKTEYKAVVFSMECGRHVESETETSRGLEHRTQEGSWARFEMKRDSYNAVLDEQDRQWKEDADDDELISKIYKKYSIGCARKAYEVALRDEQEVRKLHGLEDTKSPSKQLKSCLTRKSAMKVSFNAI